MSVDRSFDEKMVSDVSNTVVEEDFDRVDLLQIWQVLVQSKVTILAFTIAGLILFGVYVIFASPVYRADALLSPRTSLEGGSRAVSGLSRQLGGLAGLAGLSNTEDQQSTISIALLQSRQLAEKFILEHELMPQFFPDSWVNEAGMWKPRDENDVPTLQDSFIVFNSKVRTIEEDATSGLVTLYIDWVDPVLAAEWANSYVEMLNRYVQNREEAEIERSITYLKDQLEKTMDINIRNSLISSLSSQMELLVQSKGRVEYAFEIIDPAIVRDENKYFRPKRVVLILIGVTFGFFLGSIYVLAKSFTNIREQN